MRADRSLANRIRDGGYDSATLERVLGVSQATASRLRNGITTRTRHYELALDRFEANLREAGSLDECLADLRRGAQADPALRDALLAIRRFMRNA